MISTPSFMGKRPIGLLLHDLPFWLSPTQTTEFGMADLEHTAIRWYKLESSVLTPPVDCRNGPQLAGCEPALSRLMSTLLSASSIGQGLDNTSIRLP